MVIMRVSDRFTRWVCKLRWTCVLYLTSRNAQNPGATCAAVSRPYRTLRAGEGGRSRKRESEGRNEQGMIGLQVKVG